jgi:FAD:protein FMN transferase
MRSCSNEIRRARPLLGTTVEIRVRGLPERDAFAAMDAAFAAVARVHALMSPSEPASDLFRLNQEAARRPVRVDPWTFRVVAGARLFANWSGGAFDPTRGTVPAGTPRRLPGNWRDLRLLPGWRVRFSRPLRVDLGGIAKGFAVDRAVDVLRVADVPAGIVNAGGDLRVFGPTPEPVHVRDPGDFARFVLAGELREEALATSANYLEGPGRGRLRPPPGQRLWLGRGSASVRAPSCLAADALCKVVAVVGPRAAAALLRACGASALVLSPTGRFQREEYSHAA